MSAFGGKADIGVWSEKPSLAPAPCEHAGTLQIIGMKKPVIPSWTVYPAAGAIAAAVFVPAIDGGVPPDGTAEAAQLLELVAASTVGQGDGPFFVVHNISGAECEVTLPEDIKIIRS